MAVLVKFVSKILFKELSRAFVTQFEEDKIWCTLTPGCDCNLQLDDGTTPLHVAAGCGQSECVAGLRGKHPVQTPNAIGYGDR